MIKKKPIYTGKLPTSKRRMRNLFGFSFNIANYQTNKIERKLKINEKYFWVFAIFSHTQEESKIKLTWIIQ
jgi:hypothetical protein